MVTGPGIGTDTGPVLVDKGAVARHRRTGALVRFEASAATEPNRPRIGPGDAPAGEHGSPGGAFQPRPGEFAEFLDLLRNLRSTASGLVTPQPPRSPGVGHQPSLEHAIDRPAALYLEPTTYRVMGAHARAFEAFPGRARDELGDGLVALRLFGSVARGEASESFDLDIFPSSGCVRQPTVTRYRVRGRNRVRTTDFTDYSQPG